MMEVHVATGGRRPDRITVARGLLALALALVVLKGVLPDWVMRLPEGMLLPFADWINAGFAFLRDEFGLMAFTRAFAKVVEFLLDVTANLLYGKSRWPGLGPIPWVVIAGTMAVIGYTLGGWRLALLSGGTFVWIAVMGQWKWAMETLSVIVVAAPLSILLGLLMGAAAWRWRWVERVMNRC
jgi:glycine betaine/proline transport system permease protein